MMKLKLLVCCHKEDTKVENEYYIPIHVGKSNSDKDLHITGDNSGDNISHKNGSYCELTGMYWAWKNLKDTDYIGLCHYRRYFDFSDPKFSLPSKVINTNSFNKLEFGIPENIKKELQSGTVILPRTESSKLSLYAEYCIGHYSEDIKIVESVINKLEDKRYSTAYDKVMYDNNEFFPYNMFLMSWKEYDKYCSWLFTVLEEVESLIDISDYNPYQKRIFGFMAERLLNVYVAANNLTVKEYPVLFVSNDKHETSIYPLHKLRRIINKISSKYASPKKNP